MTVLPPGLLKLDAKQVAAYTHHHVNTVQRDAAAGVLHGSQRKRGGRWLFDRPCVDAWIAGEKCTHQLEEAS